MAENVRREVLELTVTIQELRGSLGTDAGNAGIAVGGIADEREQIGNQRRIDAELLADGGGIANDFAATVDLHHARASHALRQVLIGCPDGDFLDLLLLRCEMQQIGRAGR